jgi:ribulose-phosphate 3-epimerase
MCADFSNLKQDTIELDKAGTDIFHIDIMDGDFVPNFGMGLQDFEFIRSVTQKPIDVHLMINNPGKYVGMFADMGADIIYIHPEADQQVTRTLDVIKNKGKMAGIALNPGTSVATVKELLPLIDYVMVMTVNPGFAGQSFLDFTVNKIEELVALSKEYDYKVMVDGAISPEKVETLSEKGVTGFILGTSSLFGKDESYETILQNLR